MLRTWRDIATGLLVATAGGGLFSMAGLPAAWLVGSMTACTVAALCGVRQAVPTRARHAVYVLIGAQIGAAFTPDAIASMARWPLSLALLGVTVAAVTAAGYLFYRRVCRWDPATAFLASCPGAFAVMLILAEREKADVPRVTVVQAIRVFFLVLVLPLAFAWYGGGGTAAVAAPLAPPVEVVLMLVAALAGALLAERSGLPAGLILGAVPPVAALQLGGIVTGQFPDWVLVPGFVVLGLIIGARFAGFSPGLLRELLLVGLAGFAIALLVAGLGAVAAGMAAGVPAMAAIVAFAPGGLEAMSIMAVALGLDPAYVGTHQIARYLALAAVLPALMPLFRRRWRV